MERTEAGKKWRRKFHEANYLIEARNHLKRGLELAKIHASIDTKSEKTIVELIKQIEWILEQFHQIKFVEQEVTT